MKLIVLKNQNPQSQVIRLGYINKLVNNVSFIDGDATLQEDFLEKVPIIGTLRAEICKINDCEFRVQE